MQVSAFSIVALLSVAAAVWSPPVSADDERDFIFTDDEGHLVLRFAGAGPSGPDRHALEEVVNESEPVDSEWAASMEPRVRAQATALGHRFSSIDAECRSTTCRLVLAHDERWSVAEHQALIEIVQRELEPLVEGDQSGFEPIFLIAAYEQQFEMPRVKVYLRRSTSRD
jgi:hypothetical protein